MSAGPGFGAIPGAPLPRWYRAVAACLRGVYFGKVRVLRDEPTPARRSAEVASDAPRPRLILSSHRNGAIDGLQVQAAFPSAQYLLSLQLLRNPILRIFFTGIPVVRPKDIERYGMDPGSQSDPVDAGAKHIAAGGDLVVFPEGTSDWGPSPAQYRTGAARIWCELQERGVDVEVIPVGLFYSAPDRFRSLAEVWTGGEVTLPQREGRSPDEWRDRVHSEMTAALDHVSVNCPDARSFNAVQSRAVERARAGESFAAAFLDEQRRGSPTPTSETPAPTAIRTRPASQSLRIIGLGLMALLWPILLAAWLTGRAADARNTVSFFRILGGSAATILWLLGLIAAVVLWPQCAAAVVAAGAAAAALGWVLVGLRRFQPGSRPIPETTDTPGSPDPPGTPGTAQDRKGTAHD